MTPACFQFGAFELDGERFELLRNGRPVRLERKPLELLIYLLASYYAQLGDKQQALAYLDESLLQHTPPILDIQNDTVFDALHSDPHYRAIVQKIGLPPAW